MNPQVNWQKIKSELNKLADVTKLSDELRKVANEIRNFDFHTVLTPQAQERVKAFEKRYGEILKTVHQAQRQVDREVNKILRQVKTHSILADGRLESLRKVAHQGTQKLSKVAEDLRSRLSKTKKKKRKVRKVKSN